MSKLTRNQRILLIGKTINTCDELNIFDFPIRWIKVWALTENHNKSSLWYYDGRARNHIADRSIAWVASAHHHHLHLLWDERYHYLVKTCSQKFGKPISHYWFISRNNQAIYKSIRYRLVWCQWKTWTIPSRRRGRASQVLDSLPLRIWMNVTITPLSSHPNDPESRARQAMEHS